MLKYLYFKYNSFHPPPPPPTICNFGSTHVVFWSMAFNFFAGAAGHVLVLEIDVPVGLDMCNRLNAGVRLF